MKQAENRSFYSIRTSITRPSIPSGTRKEVSRKEGFLFPYKAFKSFDSGEVSSSQGVNFPTKISFSFT